MKSSGAVEIKAVDDGSPAVKRGAIERARGRALDRAVAAVGIARLPGESDHGLQGRALDHAEEWGMLAAEAK